MITAAGPSHPSAPVAALPGVRGWLVVGLLAVVAALNYLDRVMLTTMHQSIVAAIPMTESQFGLLTSAFLWVYALMSPLGGYLSDRISRSKVVLASLLLWSAVTWMTAHTTTLGGLLATRVLMGAGEACYIPAALALIAEYHRGATRALATGIHMIGIAIGQGLGGLGGWLAEGHDWTYAFRLFGIIGLGYGVLLIFTLRDAPTEPTEVRAPAGRFGEAVTSLFQSRSYWVALIYWALVAIAGWAVLGWLPTLLAERFNLTQGTAGLSATGYLQPAACLGLIVGGFWSDRASRANPRGRLYVTIFGLCLAAPSIFLGANSPIFWLAIAGFMLWSFGTAFVNANMMPILGLLVESRYLATGYGILNLCSCLVGGATIYLGGVLRDAHIPVTLIFDSSVFIILLCCVLLYLIKPARIVRR